MNGETIIPEELGGSEYLFNDAPAIGSVKIIDGVIAFGPAVASIYILGPIIPQAYSIIQLIIAVTLGIAGFLALLLKPSHVGLKEHLERTYNFKFKTNKVRRNVLADGGVADFVEHKDEIEPFDEESLKELTGIKQFHYKQDALEQPNGTVVAAVKVHGANLELAMGNERNSSIAKFTRFLNNELERIGKIQMYLPMRTFDSSLQIYQFSERFNDDDVQNNPFMEEYIDSRMRYMGNYEGVPYREFFILVQLTELEFKKTELGGTSQTERLRRIPVFGDALYQLYIMFASDYGEYSEEEFKYRQIEQLHEQVDQVRSSLKNVTNNTVEVVDADELAALNAEEWQETIITDDEKDGFLKRQPYTVTAYEEAKAELKQGDNND